MRIIRISAQLEKDIRSGVMSGPALREAIVVLLDVPVAERKRARGLGYRDLLEAFKAALGDLLVLPPNPTAGWISRVVAKANEQGLEKEHVERIAAQARIHHRPPYALDYLIHQATRLLHEGAAGESRKGSVKVFTGRTDEPAEVGLGGLGGLGDVE